jgi:hypothetical protein
MIAPLRRKFAYNAFAIERDRGGIDPLAAAFISELCKAGRRCLQSGKSPDGPPNRITYEMPLMISRLAQAPHRRPIAGRIGLITRFLIGQSAVVSGLLGLCGLRVIGSK